MENNQPKPAMNGFDGAGGGSFSSGTQIHQLQSPLPCGTDELPSNLQRVLQNGIRPYLWQRTLSFLTVREQAVSVRGVSRLLRGCSDVYYMKIFWANPTTIHVPQDVDSLARAMKLCSHLKKQEGYVEATTVVVALGSGVHEVIGSCTVLGLGTRQKMLPIPCDNLSIVGKGEGETIIDGGFAVEKGRKVSIAGLTMKDSISFHSGGFAMLIAFGVGTEMILQNVTVEECQYSGVYVRDGAKLDATGCQFHQNGGHGVYVRDSTTTARLTNCISHHNKFDGVVADDGAVVDLMGEGTSVHDNEGYGLSAEESGTINVYQPCVLNDMSHGNKEQNIHMQRGGSVQQKDSKK